MLGISHYNYFPTASCLNATEMVLSSLSTTLTYAFPLQRDINFCCLTANFLQYEEKIFQLQIRKVLMQHLLLTGIQNSCTKH